MLKFYYKGEKLLFLTRCGGSEIVYSLSAHVWNMRMSGCNLRTREGGIAICVV